MSESLRNDGRIWVPKKLEDAKALQAGTKKPNDIPDDRLNCEFLKAKLAD